MLLLFLSFVKLFNVILIGWFSVFFGYIIIMFSFMQDDDGEDTSLLSCWRLDGRIDVGTADNLIYDKT